MKIPENNLDTNLARLQKNKVSRFNNTGSQKQCNTRLYCIPSAMVLMFW